MEDGKNVRLISIIRHHEQKRAEAKLKQKSESLFRSNAELDNLHTSHRMTWREPLVRLAAMCMLQGAMLKNWISSNDFIDLLLTVSSGWIGSSIPCSRIRV